MNKFKTASLMLFLMQPLISFAGTSFPVCFETVNDPLNRVYALVQDSSDPLAAVSSTEFSAVKLYEYYKSPEPSKQLYIQGVLYGTAQFDYSGVLERVFVGTVTGLDLGSHGVMTTQLEKEFMTENWTVRRSTITEMITTHPLKKISCVDATK